MTQTIFSEKYLLAFICVLFMPQQKYLCCRQSNWWNWFSWLPLIPAQVHSHEHSAGRGHCSPNESCTHVLLGLYSLALNPDIEISLKYYITEKKALGWFSLVFKMIPIFFINNFISLLMYSEAYKKTKVFMLSYSYPKKRKDSIEAHLIILFFCSLKYFPILSIDKITWSWGLKRKV